MRLFLSSSNAGKFENELKKLLGEITQFAFISNAKDYKSPAERDNSLDRNFAYYKSLGLDPVEVDLRPYFAKPGANELLENFKYIFLAGGNAFLLRRALKYSGVDKYIKKRVQEGTLIYGGESAGTIMAGPTLRGSEDKNTPEHEDDSEYIPDGYEDEVLWDGLGLIDFVPLPHYRGPDSYENYLKHHNIAYQTLRESDVFIVDGERAEILR